MRSVRSMSGRDAFFGLSHSRIAIFLALIWFAVRVAQVASEKGDFPFQSANDRSRWCTVRALVDHGTYAIDDVIRQKGWDTIDKVCHLDHAGVARFYSSKPPLLATILAGMYWVLRSVTGWTLATHPFEVVRTIVLLFNGAMLWAFLECVLATTRRYSRTSWGALFVVLTAAWGTHLTSFAVTLNNHLPAATGVAFALFWMWKLLDAPEGGPPWAYFLCGIAATWGFANELPALGFLGVVLLVLVIAAPRPTILYFLPGVALVLGAMLLTNWLAHGTWSPPYLHRVAGADFTSGNWYAFPKSYWLPENKRGIDIGEPRIMTYLWHITFGHHGVVSLTPVWWMSGAGVWAWRRRPGGRGVVWMVLGLTLVSWLFWVFRPQIDRNYSGRATAFRWLFWLIPVWLMAMIPAADIWSRRSGTRWLAWTLLVASVASAGYGWYRPWQHPWLYPPDVAPSSSSKRAFIKSGHTTVASAYTSAWRPPSFGAMNFPQLTPSE